MTPSWSAVARARPAHAVPARLLVAFAGALALALASAAPAPAQAPWWRIGAEVSPSYLPPQKGASAGEGEIVVVASDLGDGPVDGAGASPVVITDALPAGLTATSITAQRPEGQPASNCALAKLQCIYTGVVYPYDQLTVTIKVKVTIEEPPGAVTTLENTTSVEGGGAPQRASSTQQLTIGEPTPFGAQDYELGLFDEDGAPATQAGSHPFQLTTRLVLSQTGPQGHRQPVALPKDLRFALPPGLIGNPDAVEQCTMTDFFGRAAESSLDLCRPGSVVGVATVAVTEPASIGEATQTVPVFNLVPAQGEPARLGFEVLGLVFVVIDTSVRTGSDYGVVASVDSASEAAWLLSSQVTLWGVPGDSRHDNSRGWECVEGDAYEATLHRRCPEAPGGLSQAPFLTLPTACAADPASEPLTSSTELESWTQPGFVEPPAYVWSGPLEEPLGLEGCGQLPFSPALQVTPAEAHTPEVHAGSTPAGFTVQLQVPQAATLEASPEGRAEADVRDTTVTLPEGVQLNPAAASGLQACSEEQVGYEGVNARTQTQEFTGAGASCPEASKVGVVRIRTPLLAHELQGALYLAEPAPNGEAGRNPFNSLVAVYLVAEDPASGVLVKLAGRVQLEEGTGRVSTTFQNTPQLPFEEVRAELFGGERASLSTPALCRSYGAGSEASLTAWSGAVARPVSESPFEITSGPDGGACPPSPLPFAPTFDAQSANTTAGAFTPFTLEIGRPDGDAALRDISLQLPAGLAAMLAAVTPCGEPQAADGDCGPESLIGRSTVSAGLGGMPYELPGSVYLTGPYAGAPFGLSAVTPLDVGPFRLGTAVVRSTIDVNETTAAASIETGATRVIGETGVVEEFQGLPQMIKGVPSQIKQLGVTIERPEGKPFQFNPTNCAPTAITGTLRGYEGAEQSVSSPFQVGGCEDLPFAPKLTASVAGRGSKADGTSLDVKIQAPAPGPAGLAQANIAKVDLQLPAALSSRLETLQKACPEAVFNTNPAACDEGSVVGSATVHTPVLKSPLSGPVYLVSHGGAAFPDVELVLQGEGDIKLVLDGKTDIKNGITYSKFESAPDAPFTLFETELPAGPHSALTPNVPEKEEFSLCKTSLTMPTTITAQDGEVIEQDTSIAVTGCAGVEGLTLAQPTRAQLLAKALKACRSRYRKRHKQRLACETHARERYRPGREKHKPAKNTSDNRRA